MTERQPHIITYQGEQYQAINWQGREWILQETWGQVHEGKPYFWYDPSAVAIDRDDALLLKTHHNPHYFPHINYTSEIGAGLVCCLNEFHFGSYKIVFILPKGAGMFPAAWMYRHPTVPPPTPGHGNWLNEYDFVEAYSKKNTSYKSFHLFRLRKLDKLESQLHYYDQGHKRYKIERFNLGWRDMIYSYLKGPYRPITIEVEWTPEHLHQKVNGRDHRIFKGDIMQHLQHPMRVVLNAGIRARHLYDKNEVTTFRIPEFSYDPLINIS